MGPLENKMHEKFVQEYVKNGRNGLQAYKAVYPNVKDRSAGACAARLLAVARVAERFKELQAASAEGAKVTLEGLIKRLGDTATNATNDKQHSAAVAALVAQAKLAGFWGRAN
jgi:Terminase small subunit